MFTEMVYMKVQVDAGAEFVVTQMFMGPKVYTDPLQHAGLRHQRPHCAEIMCLNNLVVCSARLCLGGVPRCGFQE